MSIEIIAEVGVNHQNDPAVAEHLIRAAVAAGANTVKFQSSTVLEEVSVKAAPDHFADLGKLVPTTSFLKHCARLCQAKGVEFLCTPAGEQSLEIVLALGVRRIKVASDNLTNAPFLRAVQKTGLPVLLSTGMGTMDEVQQAVQWLHGSEVTVLHCVSAYPCPVGSLNLRAILELRRYSNRVGLSDHSSSISIPAVAVGMGARVIEKHITLSRSLPGPDHAASLEPHEFQEMVRMVVEAEMAMGNGIKRPMDVEQDGLRLYRKSLVARTAIKAGDVFTAENLTVKRPGTGIPSADYGLHLDTRASRDYAEDELI